MSKKTAKNAEERITKMEQILTKGTTVMDKLEAALEEYKQLQPDIAKLESYYTSPEWKEDLIFISNYKPNSVKNSDLIDISDGFNPFHNNDDR